MLIAKQQKLICIADGLGLGWTVVAEYNVEAAADDSKGKKSLEKAKKSSERTGAKQKKKHIEPASIKWDTSFVSNL